MEIKPTYSIKDIVNMILACGSLNEVEAVKNLLIKDLNNYAVADQGFLLTMVGIQIMKLDDGDRGFDRFFRECIVKSIMVSE